MVTAGVISVVGIISVVIGGHFGGGDHFDGGDHFGGGTASAAQNARHLTFLKNFGQIPGYVGSSDSRMPHQLALQKASKTPSHQRLFKNFAMHQTICSNYVNILLNRIQISDQVSERCLTEVCSFQ